MSTLDILLSSLADSTLKQYDSATKSWNYCKDHDICQFDAHVNVVLEFLAYLFNKGETYGTLNSTCFTSFEASGCPCALKGQVNKSEHAFKIISFSTRKLENSGNHSWATQRGTTSTPTALSWRIFLSVFNIMAKGGNA